MFDYYGWERVVQVEHLYTSALRMADKLENLGFVYKEGQVGLAPIQRGRDP